MANIQTEKKTVLLIGESNVAEMSVAVHPARVDVCISNEGVKHTAQLFPNEAVQLGVQLIQLGGQAHLLAMQHATEPQRKGLPDH